MWLDGGGLGLGGGGGVASCGSDVVDGERHSFFKFLMWTLSPPLLLPDFNQRGAASYTYFGDDVDIILCVICYILLLLLLSFQRQFHHAVPLLRASTKKKSFIFF